MFEMFGIEPEMAENGLRIIESYHRCELGRKMEKIGEPDLAAEDYDEALILYRENKAAVKGLKRVIDKIQDPVYRRVLIKTRINPRPIPKILLSS